MPFLAPNQQHLSTEGNNVRATWQLILRYHSTQVATEQVVTALIAATQTNPPQSPVGANVTTPFNNGSFLGPM